MSILKQLGSRTRIFVTGVNSPKLSNAFEVFLFNQKLDKPHLFVRQSTPTVVIGSNQNPWLECDVNKMKDDKVELMRRTTGGGTVYLDQGNLLVGFIGNLTKYPDLSKHINNKLICDSIKETFGVNALPSGRNDIMVNERKVAGSAFRYNEIQSNNYILHHLSILVSADMLALSKYITPDKRKLESKGIKSVRSRVTNLSEYDKSKDVIDLRSSIIDNFVKLHGEDGIESIRVTGNQMLEIPEVKKIYDELRSDDWLYGKTPVFTYKLDNRFSWGSIYLFLNVNGLVIENVTCNTDALSVDLPFIIKQIMLGKPYDRGTLEAYFDIYIDEYMDAEVVSMLADIKKWLIKEI